jgi:hypothetical protein
MKRIQITIEGISPLLMNKFGDEAAMKATSGNKTAQAGTPLSPHEDAEKRLHVTEGGVVIIPQPNIAGSIREGGKFFKTGRTKITTQRTSLVPAGIFFDAPYYKLESKSGWSVDTRPIRNPVTGGRINRYRPIFHDWKFSFSIEVDTDVFDLKLVREIVDAAGSKIGLCDFRPDCKGPFGRFKVIHWDVEKD